MFLKVNLWGKSAKPMLQYLLKGKQIGVTGTLSHSLWTGRDGKEHDEYVIGCFGVTLLGDKKSGDEDDDDTVF
jgi:single-stranded DNA-binding protein